MVERKEIWNGIEIGGGFRGFLEGFINGLENELCGVILRSGMKLKR